MPSVRMLLRQARTLQAIWSKGFRQQNHPDHLWRSAAQTWAEMQKLDRQIVLAVERDYRNALRVLRDDLRWKLDGLIRSLQSVREELVPPRAAPSLSDWLGELRALDDEFGNLQFDAKREVVRVTTEPVTLREVELGPFAIELNWPRLEHRKGSLCFEIVAVRPNPASGRGDVVHPHLNDGELCAGDAAKPLERALAEGRLSEAFLLIRSVLTTYNPKSAYVALEDWDGLNCGDCNGRMQRDNASYCESCHSDLCDSCVTSCRSCEETRCGGCLNACGGCSDLCCARCLETIGGRVSLCSSCRGICTSCDRVLLASELDENGDCPDCTEETEEPETEPTNPPTPMEAIHDS